MEPETLTTDVLSVEDIIETEEYVLVRFTQKTDERVTVSLEL